MVKMPRPVPSARLSRSPASRKAGALNRVRVVPSEAASDIGISRREAASFCSRASRIRIGNIIAVTITWCEKAASSAVAGITTAIVRHSLPPAVRPIQAPIRSVMPVDCSPAESTNTAATMIAGSLEKPARACLASRIPVRASASRVSMATRSTRIRPLTNSARAEPRITRKTIWSSSMQRDRCRAAGGRAS